MIVLLRGSSKAGRLAAEAIAEAGESELPALMHELVTTLLLAPEMITRSNSSMAIKLLCVQHRTSFRKLLLESRSDGELLLLSELKVSTILRSKRNGNELLSSHSTYNDTGGDAKSSKLYGKKWLQKQRKALEKRLGMESGSLSDVGTAVAFDGSNNLIESTDFVKTSAGREKMDDSDNDEDDGEGDDMGTEGKCEIDTNETWLARLVRFMAIGLLDPSWEVRHGCSAGLTDLINGLVEGPNGANGAPPHTDNNTVESGELPPFPSFLVEDLICTGLCVLILDGFIDFGNELFCM